MKNKIYIPDLAVLELTYRCNHTCLFCSCPWEAEAAGSPHYEKGKELELDEWKRALDKLQTLGVKNISISGGEALLKEGLLELIDYIRTLNHFNRESSIVLISNGLAMNDAFLAAFKEYNIHLSMSLPGLETFKTHTGVDNAEGVLYWLEKAHQAGIETTVNVTVTRLNYHELYETIAHGLLAGADTLLLNRFLPGGRGLSHIHELTLNRSQLNGMLDTAEEILQLSNRLGSVGTEFPLCIIERRGAYKQLQIGSICSAAKSFFAIDPAGYIRACNHSPRKVGHIFDETIISDTAYWSVFSRRAYIPSGCTFCKEVNYCDCGCREVASIVCGSCRAEDPCMNEDYR